MARKFSQILDLEDLPFEVWLPVVGREQEYAVSNMGRVKSLERYVPCGGHRQKLLRARILRSSLVNGYPTLPLGKGNTRRVNMLVAEAFHGKRPPGAQAAHENGIRHDNRASNLEWKTPKENAKDKRRHGTAWKDKREKIPRTFSDWQGIS